jgi:hypothetical protein
MKYNCVAWAAGETRRKWWPDRRNIGYWPSGVIREETLEAFILAFISLGYSPCGDGEYEIGFEKVAIFVIDTPSGLSPKHVARQLDCGHWTSKLGDLADIEHTTVQALIGPGYGRPQQYLKRSIKKT